MAPSTSTLRLLVLALLPATLLAQCTNTCYWQFDDWCDDGGPGAEYGACFIGTDCEDCGNRAGPPTAPPAYPPVPPLTNNPFAFGHVVPMLVGNEVIFDAATTAAWASKDYQPAAIGLARVFGCNDGNYDTPRCVVEIAATDVGDIPATAPYGGYNAAYAGLKKAAFTVTFPDVKPVLACPPAAPYEPPTPPTNPPPPPPPTPWYALSGDLNMNVMADAYVMAAMRLQPPPPPLMSPSPPNCATVNLLHENAEDAPEVVKANVTNMTLGTVNMLFAAAPDQLVRVAGIGSTPGITLGTKSHSTRAIYLPPSPPPPPPSPSTPPVSPPPPLPPSPPPALCSELGDESGIGTPGQCDDGVDGQDNLVSDRNQVLCELGTDCKDCGIRYYCQSCPQECYDRAVTLGDPMRSCLEYMYQSDMCWEQCNVAECADSADRAAGKHKSCTVEASIKGCVKREAEEAIDYVTKPADAGTQTTSVHLDLDFGQLKIAVDKDRGTGVIVDTTLSYTLNWTDTRFATSGCRIVMNDMLSSKGELESEYVHNYWRPQMEISTNVEPARSLKLIDSAFEYDAEGPANRPALLHIKQKVEVPQPFKYEFYPFDNQTVVLDLKIPGVDLGTSCHDLVHKLRTHELGALSETEYFLPSSGAWMWRTCGTSGGMCTMDAISQDITLDSAIMAASTDVCPIRLSIRRNNLVFVVKQLTPLIIIAEAPLIALWLNPTIPPLVGARCSIHIFAMVLILLQSNKNLGLGTLNGIIWVDEFALMQFIIILIGLFETIFVHACIRMDKAVLALSVDGVFRKLLPFVVYPVLVIGWMCKGNKAYTLAYVVMIGGIGGSFALGVFYSMLRVTRIAAKRAKVIRALVRIDIHDDDEDKVTNVMKEAFETFDLDNSQKLDKKEVRLILKSMYPNMTRKQTTMAMKAVQEEEIPFEDFAECVEAWAGIASKPPDDVDERPTLFQKLFRSPSKKVPETAAEKAMDNVMKKQKIAKFWSQETEESQWKMRAAGQGGARASALLSAAKEAKAKEAAGSSNEAPAAASAFSSALGKCLASGKSETTEAASESKDATKSFEA